MKKIITVSLMILGLMLGGMKIAAANNSDPVSMVQSLANEMIASLKAHKASLKTNRSLVYSLAYSIVIPHADLDEMSQRVVSPQVWKNATPSQREEFKKLYTNLLVKTYSSALADYTDQTIRFFPVRGSAGNSVTVNSKIVRSDGPSIDVSYRLHLKGSQWLLYDMSVEGVSMLSSWKDQLSSKGSMEQLIQYLKQRNVQRAR